MTKTINSIEAAKIEAAGNGNFSIVGRSLRFVSNKIEYRWNLRSEAEARSTLALFRASLKYAA